MKRSSAGEVRNVSLLVATRERASEKPASQHEIW